MARSEREKMLAGELYDASEPALLHARRRAEELCRRYNATFSNDHEARRALLEELFGEVGEGVTVMPPLHCDYGSQVRIGRGSFVNFDCIFLDGAPIVIGEGAQIAPRVQLLTATHPLEPNVRRSGRESARPVRIGNNVWLGAGTIVCPGVTIGDDTVVGAGSVVTKDLPPGVLAVGNPCRVLRPLP